MSDKLSTLHAYRWVAVMALLGVLLSTLAYQYGRSREENRLQMQFNHLAQDRVLRLQATLDQSMAVLTSMRGLFDASEAVTRAEFRVMAAPILERDPDIMALNWAPKVSAAEREATERGLRLDGFAAQGIFEVSQDGGVRQPAASSPCYFPVLYSEPAAGGPQVIGIDPYTRPENRAAMDAAMKHGVQWSTRPFVPVQAPEGPRAVAVYQPVYQRDRPLTSEAAREAALRGFIILVIRPGVVLQNTLGKLSPAGIDTQLLDSGNHLLHQHRDLLEPSVIRPEEPLVRDFVVKLPGRDWTVRVRATEAFHRHADSLEDNIVLAAGLLLTLLVSLFLALLSRQSQRTLELGQNLKESETRFRQLAENIDAAFWILTPDWQQVLYISPAYEHIWGRSVESLYARGMDWLDAVLLEDRPALLAHMPAAGDNDWQTIAFPPYRIRRPGGDIRWVAARASPIRDERGQISRVAGIAEDITERQEYQRHLEDLAHYDPLTHLPNRRLLADRMRQALAHAQRTGQLLAVCMLDLDGFKPVNDSHGHKVGDQLLIEVAHRLLDGVRGDDTVARLGGDEFVLLLGGLDSVREADEMLTRLLHILAAPYRLVEQQISLTASIGVTLFPSDSGNADTLLRHADHAMYLAKEAGKNRYFLFNPVLELRERDNRTALHQIETATEENQLRLHYQPVVDCRVGRVVGMEALLRWEHPLFGLMNPAEFLPLVENNDRLARRVGGWVLQEALNQAERWHQAGQDVPISINTFIQQLRDPDFPEQIRHALAQHPDLPVGCLTLEIIESSAIDDFASVTRLIRTVSELNIRFALDDFGTGFSSLTYLRRLPVNSLKIDQTFVRDMLLDPGDLSIVEGVVGLAAAFRHQAIAEGVESADHVLMLQEMGCHLVQGYGIARPMPGDVALDWLRQFRPDPRWLENAAQRLSRDDFQLVLAEVSHRQWLGSLRNWVHQPAEDRGAAPPLDGHKCNFGHWYYGEGGGRYSHLQSFRAIEARHDHIHQLARRLVESVEKGDIVASRQIEAELQRVSESFRDELVRIRGEVKYSEADH